MENAQAHTRVGIRGRIPLEAPGRRARDKYIERSRVGAAEDIVGGQLRSGLNSRRGVPEKYIIGHVISTSLDPWCH